VTTSLPPVPKNSSTRGAWLLRWDADKRKTTYLCALVIVACTLFLLIYLSKIWNEYEGQTPGHPPRFVDFFSLWSYAKIAGAHPVAELYDFATLHARQVALGMAPGDQSPFPYPPTFLLLLWPLNLLSYDTAYLAWILGTLALFVWAVRATCSRLPLCVLGVVVAPASTLTIYAGQSGFLAAALIVAGVRLADSRPVLAGFLIGVLTYKPQLGFLVPVAFASAGLWTAFAAACATVAGLALLATLAYGWAAWPAWVAMLPTYADWFDKRPEVLKFMPTVIGNLRMAGVSLAVAQAAQALVTVAVVVLVARCFRRNPGRLAAAALLVGTILATPHAFFYELPMVMAAIALFIEARMDVSPIFSGGEVLVLVLAVAFPALMLMQGVNLPVSAVPLLLLFGLIVRQHGRSAGNARRAVA
jgi:hypothetical protein